MSGQPNVPALCYQLPLGTGHCLYKTFSEEDLCTPSKQRCTPGLIEDVLC